MKQKYQFKLSVLTLMFFGVCLVSAVQVQAGIKNGWHIAASGNKGFASENAGYETDIAVSEAGEMYIAFQDKRLNKRVRVRKLVSNKWIDLADNNNPKGAVSGAKAFNPNLAVRNGKVFVAFMDVVAGNRVRVKEWNGSVWRNLADGTYPDGLISFDIGEEPEIKFNRSGTLLYATWRDIASGGRIKVLKWDGVNWSAVTSDNFPDGLISPGSAAEVTLVASKINDSMYFAYEDVTQNFRLAVKKWDGANWSAVADATHPDGLVSATPAYSPSIDVDSMDRIYAVYTYEREGRTYLHFWDGTNWQILGNGIVAEKKTIESTVGVSSKDEVFVAMSQYKKVGKKKIAWGTRVRKWNGNRWVDLEDKKYRQGFISRKGKGDPALAFSGGRIFVSFTDYASSRRARLMSFKVE